VEDADLSGSRFDTAIECLMAGLLAFMPLAFGAVEAWSELIVVAAASVMAMVLACKLVLRPAQRFVWSWTYVPISLFILLIAMQLVRFPKTIVSDISPATAEIKTWLLSDLPEATNSMTLSFYPLAGRHDLRLVLAAATIFVVTLNIYARPARVKRLLFLIAAIGGAVAALALVQDIIGAKGIYGRFSMQPFVASSGPFVNHSHFGQFMNLSIGAALALALVRKRGLAIIFPVVVIVLCATALIASLTRGGMISMLAAGVFTAVIVARRANASIRASVGSILCILIAGVLLLGGFDLIYRRFSSVARLHEAEAGRWQMLRDVATAWRKFPLLGFGLGGHEFVFPMFDRSGSALLATHAENEYAQLAEETGAIGLTLAVVFVVTIWTCYSRALRGTDRSIFLAAAGLGFGLLAVQIHSFTDFGEHVPAIALLTAVICGIVVNLGNSSEDILVLDARMYSSVRSFPQAHKRLLFALSPIAALLLVLATSIWMTGHAVRAWRAEANENEITRAEWEPDNVTYKYWLSAYRWKSTVHEPDTTRRIVDELNRARALCPTFGPAYCLSGQLEEFVLNDHAGRTHIKTAVALSPHDPTAWFTAAQLDAADARWTDCVANCRHATALDGTIFKDAVDMLVNGRQPDLALSLAGENWERLWELAGILRGKEGLAQVAALARSRAVELMRAEAGRPSARPGLLATVAEVSFADGDYHSAETYYRQALAANYDEVDWRLNRARALARLGRKDEAEHEARICARLRPGMPAAMQLIASLGSGR
jgi:tetratricopeptide (TPR) repeat protein